MIAAITFDFWNTLYRPAFARSLRIQRLLETLTANRHAVTLKQIDAADEAAREEWNRIWRDEHRTLNAADWLHLMLRSLEIELPLTEFEALAAYFDRSALEANPSPMLVDGLAELLPRLSTRYRLGVISDTGLSSGRTLREFLKRDGVLDCFGCLTFSDELGASKPDARAFLSTLNCLGASPSQAVHIGDLTHSDIAGAKSVGMLAVRFVEVFDDPNQTVTPDAVLHSYAELESWLARA
jgi:HAD superfamily hydrolase (TIGR01549 family)